MSTEGPSPSPTSEQAATWRQLAHVIDEGQVRRVVADAGSVWAVGFTGQTSTGLGGVPIIWRSDAAGDWTRVELPIPVSATMEPQVLVDVEHLAAVDGRLYAFGSISALDSGSSVAWVSSDNGQTWTEVNGPPSSRVQDVTGGRAGLVVIGSLGFSPGWRVYSPSGSAPTWTDLSPFAADAGTASTVVGTSEGYVLGGSVGGPDTRVQPRIWLSVDGRTWRAADIEGSDGEGSVSAVTVDGSGRWVALGLLGSEVTTWTSVDDGRSWQVGSKGDLSADDVRYAQLQLAGLAQGYAIVSTSGPAWFSHDGVAWTKVDPWPMPDGGESSRGLARVGDSLILVHNDVPFHTGGSVGAGWAVWAGLIGQ